MITVGNVEWDSYFGEGSPSQVYGFEKSQGISFPKRYKYIVEHLNGAYPVNKDSFKFRSKLIDDEVVFDSGMFLPYDESKKSGETMEVINSRDIEGFPKGLIVFSVLGNGDFLCFDYREVDSEKEPSVVVWHHAGEDDNESISFVSSTFDQFLDELFEE